MGAGFDDGAVVADAVALFGDRGAEGAEQVGLAGAGVPGQAQPGCITPVGGFSETPAGSFWEGLSFPDVIAVQEGYRPRRR